MAFPKGDDFRLEDKVTFATALHPSDIDMMTHYNRVIKERTVDLTGGAIQERLARIDAEFKRMEEAKHHLGRLKAQTKAAIFGAVSE
jgi:hypothetical protein